MKMFSDEWWEILHLALKTATELDIELGYSTPRWSQSGDRASAGGGDEVPGLPQVTVQGAQEFKQALPQPTDEFQDVKVVAFPSPGDDSHRLSHLNASILSNPSVAGLSKITDRDNRTGITFPADGEFQLLFKTEKPFTATSLTLQIAESPLHARASLEAKQEIGEYTTVAEFEVNRSNTALNVGFDPYAPVVITLPEVTATRKLP